MAAAPFVATQAYVTLNSVSIQGWVESAALTDKYDEVDVTTFGSGGAQNLIAGLQKGALALTVLADYQAGSALSTILTAKGTQVTFELRATQAARGATNPAFTGTVLIGQFDPLNAKIGDASKISFSFPLVAAIAGPLTS